MRKAAPNNETYSLIHILFVDGKATVVAEAPSLHGWMVGAINGWHVVISHPRTPQPGEQPTREQIAQAMAAARAA